MELRMRSNRRIMTLTLGSLFLLIGSAAYAEKALQAQIQLLENTQSVDPGGWRELTAHSDPKIRRMSVRAIGRIDHPRLSRFIKAALKVADASVRSEAAFACGQSTVLPVSQILESLKNEKDFTVRITLFESLGKRGSAIHIPVILEALKTSSPEMRPSLFRASHRLNRMAPQGHSDFNAYLSRPGFLTASPATRRAWAQSLAIASAEGCDARLETIRQCVQDPDAQVRTLCAEATYCLTNGSALRLALLDDPHWLVRVSTVVTMGVAGDTDGLTQALHRLAAIHRLDRLLFHQSLPRHKTHERFVMAFVSAAMKTPLSRSNASYIQSIQKTPTALSDDARCGLAAILDRQHKNLRKTKSCGSEATSDARRKTWQLRVLTGLSPKKQSGLSSKY